MKPPNKQQLLIALDESIAHWERLASGNRKEDEGIGPADCALCQLVCPITSGCGKCPIAQVNINNVWCKGTPHMRVTRALYYFGIESPQFKDAAAVELAFLKDVKEQYLKLP